MEGLGKKKKMQHQLGQNDLVEGGRRHKILEIQLHQQPNTLLCPESVCVGQEREEEWSLQTYCYLYL